MAKPPKGYYRGPDGQAAEHDLVLDGGWRAPRADLRPAAGEARPYALQDLLDVAGVTVAQLAWRTRQHDRQLHRWKTSGLTVDQAGLLAVRAGYHPAEVWPGWLSEAS
jgi:hypothetical protein